MLPRAAARPEWPAEIRIWSKKLFETVVLRADEGRKTNDEGALAAGEGTRAAVLMERFIEQQPLAEYYELYTLQRWLMRLSEAVLPRGPGALRFTGYGLRVMRLC